MRLILAVVRPHKPALPDLNLWNTTPSGVYLSVSVVIDQQTWM